MSLSCFSPLCFPASVEENTLLRRMEWIYCNYDLLSFWLSLIRLEQFNDVLLQENVSSYDMSSPLFDLTSLDCSKEKGSIDLEAVKVFPFDLIQVLSCAPDKASTLSRSHSVITFWSLIFQAGRSIYRIVGTITLFTWEWSKTSPYSQWRKHIDYLALLSLKSHMISRLSA